MTRAMRRRGAAFGGGVALGLLLVAQQARAHLLPGQAVTLNVRGSAVFAAFSIPVSALTGFDDDGDRRLSLAELSTHRASLGEQVQRGITLTDGARVGALDFLELSVEPDDHGVEAAQTSTHVLALFKRTFPTEPTDLRLTMHVFGRDEVEQRYSVQAVQSGRSEMALLTVSRTSHEFFQTPLERFGAIGGVLLLVSGAGALLAVRRAKAA